MRRSGDQLGSAAVEHLALTALVAGLIALTLAALSSSHSGDEARSVAGAIGRRLACAPRYPEPCNRHPLAIAYGFPIGKLVRMLAPAPAPMVSSGAGLLLPVDFRRCRQPSCASPGRRRGLTASNRRVTLYTQVGGLHDEGGSGGTSINITYWSYRPRLGWSAVARSAGPTAVTAAAGIRLRVTDTPALVPLETLAGRSHARFPAAEEPPWRWLVGPR